LGAAREKSQGRSGSKDIYGSIGTSNATEKKKGGVYDIIKGGSRDNGIGIPGGGEGTEVDGGG